MQVRTVPDSWRSCVELQVCCALIDGKVDGHWWMLGQCVLAHGNSPNHLGNRSRVYIQKWSCGDKKEPACPRNGYLSLTVRVPSRQENIPGMQVILDLKGPLNPRCCQWGNSGSRASLDPVTSGKAAQAEGKTDMRTGFLLGSGQSHAV